MTQDKAQLNQKEEKGIEKQKKKEQTEAGGRVGGGTFEANTKERLRCRWWSLGWRVK